MKLLGTISVGFDVTDELLIRIFCIRQILENKWENICTFCDREYVQPIFRILSYELQQISCYQLIGFVYP
jgi:hypothetical protein